jgi:glycosyltransferase involved in cell wall biosynthesis
MAAGDIGTAFYSNINVNNYYCASNKLFEYIALEKPVLTNNYPGLIERVERLKLGVCLDAITPENLASAYVRAFDSTVLRRGSAKFFWEIHENELVGLYNHPSDSFGIRRSTESSSVG